MVGILHQCKEKVLVLQRLAEVELLPRPHIGNTALLPERQPENPTTHRGNPQRIPMALPNRMDITKIRRKIPAQGPDRSARKRLIVDTVSLGTDPHNAAGTLLQRKDRMVGQPGPGTVDLDELRRLATRGEVRNLNDTLPLGGKPQLPPRVQQQAPNRFGQVVGQLVVGVRVKRQFVVGIHEKPLPVAADPDNILFRVLEQAENSAVDVKPLGFVFAGTLRRKAKLGHPVEEKRHQKIIAVTDRIGDLAVMFDLVPDVGNVLQHLALRIERIEHTPGIDQQHRIPVGKSIAERHRLYALQCPQPARFPRFAGRKVRAVDSVRTENIDRIADSGPRRDITIKRKKGLNPTERRVLLAISVERVALRKYDRFGLAAADQKVDALKLLVLFDHLIVMHQVQSVVGPQPAVTVQRRMDLLDQVARQRLHTAVRGWIATHVLPVPNIEPFTGPEPDKALRILVQTENGVVADPVPAGNHPQIPGLKRRKRHYGQRTRQDRPKKRSHVHDSYYLPPKLHFFEDKMP